MPYTRVTRTPNGAEAISYARGEAGKGHNDAAHRNEYITGINMLPDEIVPFEEQMQPFWNKADPRHKIQIDRYIISYAKSEFNADKPEEIAKAHEVSCELAREMAPGHQIAVFTQIDGKGGMIHSHFLVNDVNLETCKGLKASAYWYTTLERKSAEIVGKYCTLAQQEKAADKVSRTERIKREQGKYVWKDDLKQRILAAATAATDEATFMKELTKRGVEGTKRPATKKQPEYYLYELTETGNFPDGEKIPKNLKAKSYKMGEDYQPKGIARRFTQKQPETEAPKQTTPIPAPSTVIAEQVQAGPEKSPAKIKKEQETASMNMAELKASATASQIYRASRGWKEKPADVDEMRKQQEEIAGSWSAFKRWRVDMRSKKIVLPPIYKRHDSNFVEILYDELEKQYGIFLHPEKWPEPPKKDVAPSSPGRETTGSGDPYSMLRAKPAGRTGGKRSGKIPPAATPSRPDAEEHERQARIKQREEAQRQQREIAHRQAVMAEEAAKGIERKTNNEKYLTNP